MGRGDLVDLDDAGSDPVIAAQIARFAGLSRRWEWRHYSYDRPDLTLDVAPPAGMELREVAAVIASVGHVPVAPGTDRVPPRHRVRRPVGGGTLPAWRARCVPRDGGPPGCRGGGEGLPLPPGGRVPRQPADPRASRVRCACHHDPLHTPGRDRPTVERRPAARARSTEVRPAAGRQRDRWFAERPARRLQPMGPTRWAVPREEARPTR